MKLYWRDQTGRRWTVEQLTEQHARSIIKYIQKDRLDVTEYLKKAKLATEQEAPISDIRKSIHYYLKYEYDLMKPRIVLNRMYDAAQPKGEMAQLMYDQMYDDNEPYL